MFHEKYRDFTDAGIISEYRAGKDNRLIGILYQRYGHLVFGLCLKYLKNKVEAQDAVVSIFEKLINDLLRHKVEFFKSWLYTYSKNHCLMELRKRQTELRRELDLRNNSAVFMENTDAGHLNEKEKQFDLLEKALLDLKEEQRICITHFYLEKRSYSQITEITGFTLNEVKSFIQNGKRNLKLIMENPHNERQQRQ